jgi:hypothetical protein
MAEQLMAEQLMAEGRALEQNPASLIVRRVGLQTDCEVRSVRLQADRDGRRGTRNGSDATASTVRLKPDTTYEDSATDAKIPMRRAADENET